MKKITALAAAVGLSASFAAHADNAVMSPSLIPLDTTSARTGIMLELEGIMAQPVTNRLEYAQVQTIDRTRDAEGNTTSIVTSNATKSIQPNYKGAFRIGIGYQFPNTTNDVQLHWTHLNSKNSDSVTGNLPNVTVVPVLGGNIMSGNAGTTFGSATSDVEFTYNAIDLDVGQYINPTPRLQLRLFGGLRYAEMKQDFDARYNTSYNADTSETNNQASLSASNHAKYSGIGPRLGIDSLYSVGNGFGLAARVAGSLLIGQAKSNESNASVNLGQSYPESNNTNADDVTRIVPGLDGQLGIHYTHALSHSADLNAELGWRVTHYFNPFDNEPIAGLTTSSDFGFHGPYLTIGVNF